jgi:GTP-binding protein
LNVTTIELVKKIRKVEDVPDRGLQEISFIGRSNVGKSSALNSLIGRKTLSPVSKSPGRTRELLYFLINDRFFFVDLPGYGFAQRRRQEKELWKELIEVYLSREGNPKGIVHILDIRHEPSALDMQMISWLAESGKPTLFLLTKADKLSRGRAVSRAREISRMIAGTDEASLITFSAKTGQGKKEVWGAITELLNL